MEARKKTTRPSIFVFDSETHRLVNKAIDEYETWDNPIPEKENLLNKLSKAGRDRAREYRIEANKTPNETALFNKLLLDVLDGSKDLDSSSKKLRRRFLIELCKHYKFGLTEKELKLDVVELKRHFLRHLCERNNLSLQKIEDRAHEKIQNYARAYAYVGVTGAAYLDVEEEKERIMIAQVKLALGQRQQENNLDEHTLKPL